MRLIAIVGGLAIAGLLLLAWTQPWANVDLTTGATVELTGSDAAPALAALGLAALALAAALTLAGVVFRVVLAVLQALIGVTVVASTAFALSSAATTAAPAVTKLTGVTGSESVAALLGDVAWTAWPVIAIIGGGLCVLHGAFVLATARKWPRSGQRFERADDQGARARRDGGAEPPRDAIGDWDALSGGDDPTAR
ncbi:Trp biosynthesis-associated membrane protein [Ruicaihuangia caeni]|uniref:Trp biosynthesis-associated membrane protein n=1 Tax=Ruicaihuangia caeni TaxID=3042517 RepID=A0AAW6T6X5_9MICO|nr:Trp biosynthesis-associated membrane protein [Klugiella sp. YN-L-19]MDI2098089.1 Trp biosynthesis-associated membrane protein [Klugiella sp. YN-L-19]